MEELDFDRIHRLSDDAHQRNIYWNVNRPNIGLKLAGSILYIQRNGSDPNDPILYYPDLRMFGRMKDIVNVLDDAGFDPIPVGELYTQTAGQFGSPPGEADLSNENILKNSYNPAEPRFQAIIQGWNQYQPLGPMWLTDFNNPANSREVSREQFQESIKSIPESQKYRYQQANDRHYNPGLEDYEIIVRTLGVYYDQLFDQLGGYNLERIQRYNSELLPQLRPLNPNDPTVRFLNTLGNGHLAFMDAEDMVPHYVNAMGDPILVAVQRSNGSAAYLFVTPR